MPELVPAVPGSPEWLAARPALKLSPYSRTGMIHGAWQAAMCPLMRPGYHPACARSWMYRRGFARAFLAARKGLTVADLSTDDQRWAIFDLFMKFGIKDIEQMRADAARILKLDYLPDMRQMTRADADELIGELRRALARERVSDE